MGNSLVTRNYNWPIPAPQDEYQWFDLGRALTKADDNLFSVSTTASESGEQARLALANSTLALNTVQSAVEKADDALEEARAIKDTADEALATANNADVNASNAVNAVNNLTDDVNLAISQAGSADQKASQALAYTFRLDYSTSTCRGIPSGTIVSSWISPTLARWERTTNTLRCNVNISVSSSLSGRGDAIVGIIPIGTGHKLAYETTTSVAQLNVTLGSSTVKSGTAPPVPLTVTQMQQIRVDLECTNSTQMQIHMYWNFDSTTYNPINITSNINMDLTTMGVTIGVDE